MTDAPVERLTCPQCSSGHMTGNGSLGNNNRWRTVNKYKKLPFSQLPLK